MPKTTVMKNYILIILSLIALAPQVAHACSCAPGSFCPSIVDSQGNFTPDLILRGKVSNANTHPKDIEIIELVHGQTSETNIQIFSDFCTVFFNELKAGNEYLIAIREVSDGFGYISDGYALIDCATSFLLIENEMLVGRITNEINQMEYSEFLNLSKNGATFPIDISEDNIDIFPNPTTQILKLKNNSDDRTISPIQVTIFNTAGQEMASYVSDNIEANETFEIDLYDFASGLYLVQITGRNEVLTYKIVKEYL